MYKNYVSSMNARDKQVRIITNYDSPTKYIAHINSSQKHTINQDHKLSLIIIKKFARLRDTLFDIQFFNDEAIENGYPHTMKTTIMLPVRYYFNMTQQKQRVILLLHEFMHIYQRSHPFEFNHLLIHTLGLTVDNFTDAYYKDTRRLNPDINALLYDGGYGHEVMLYEHNPKTLADAYVHIQSSSSSTELTLFSKLVKEYERKIHIQSEHPYEVIACISSHVMYTNDDSVKELYDWLNTKEE